MPMARWDGFIQDHPRRGAFLDRVKKLLPPLTFISLHYAYFISVCLITSIIFWGSSNANFKVSYVDSLFLVVSAMTEAGLNTVNLSQVNTWQQVLLWLLIMFGSTIWVSIWTVLARKHAFEKRFDDIVAAARARKLKTTSPGLPFLQRFATFRKAQTNPSTAGPTALPGMGSRVPSKSEPNGRAGVIQPVSQNATSLPELSESSPGPASEPVPAQGVSADRPISGARDNANGHIKFADNLQERNGSLGLSSSYAAATRSPSQRAPAAAASPTGAAVATWAQGAGERQKPNREPRTIREFLDNTPVGRNGQFHDLTSEERDQLGGVEYRALKILAVVVPLYFVLWQLLGCIALGAWISNRQPTPALNNGMDPWWLGVFNGVSAFNNSGMSLLDANMVPFDESFFVLITMGLLILAGNTAYPIFLRLILWSGLRLLRATTDEASYGDLKATLEFILKYPRRVYTNLFPSRPTWWLLFMAVLLNSIDWVAFELLNLGNPVIEGIPKGARVLDGLFQALAVRSGGFYVVPIANVYIGLQVLYVIMMYISVYPVVITMRHSNVYEERSLGIYAEDQQPGSADPEVATASQRQLWSSHPRLPRHRVMTGDSQHHSRPGAELGHTLRRTLTPWHGVGASPPGDDSRISFISQQIHGQLAHDIWWLVLAVLAISTIETANWLADPKTYSVFNIIFEVVSAYGCVGISVGVPFDSYSFSGGWSTGSKLVLCAVMLRGRHRGLPVALDRAVRLPGEQLHREEEEDHRIRRSMTASRRMSVDGL